MIYDNWIDKKKCLSTVSNGAWKAAAVTNVTVCPAHINPYRPNKCTLFLTNAVRDYPICLDTSICVCTCERG